MDVASPHTRKLLRDYKRQSQARRWVECCTAAAAAWPAQGPAWSEPAPVRERPAACRRLPFHLQDRSQLMYLQRFRATSATLLRIEAGALTLRGAFSHIPFWKTASDAVQRVVMAPAGGVTPRSSATSPTAPGLQRGGGSASPGQLQRAGTTSSLAGPLPPPFRPSSLQISLGVQQATVVLCNDKAETFGAPDVLQCSLANVGLAYDQATLLPDRPANKAGKSYCGPGAACLLGLFCWPGISECRCSQPAACLCPAPQADCR